MALALVLKKKHDLRKEYDKIGNYEQFEAFAIRYADEIDNIEKQILEEIPRAEHMDLEAD